MNVQTRDLDGDIKLFVSIKDAFEYANCHNVEVWKISFTMMETGERVRLVKSGNAWILQDVFGETNNPIF